MKKILITGISGFVGSNLVDYFASNSDYTILGLDIIDSDIKGVKKIYSWDNLSEIEDVDIVIHLAGKAHDLKKTSNDNIYFEVNYELTRKIYDWYINSCAKKFFMMSSVKAIADKVDNVLYEDTIPNPITAYGKSKLKAEEYIKSFVTKKEKEFYIFRPTMIHGFGNKGNLNLLYSVVSKGFPWPLASFNNRRSFLSIDNLSFVFNKFINEDYESGVYNISDDEPVSTNELIRVISDVKGRKLRLMFIPPLIIKIVAKFGDFLRLPLNSERLQKLTENYVVSNDKLITVLKEDLPVSAKSGLRRTIESFN